MRVGQQLSEARERQNLTLADISRTTKIPVHLLDAIERNDIDHLPQEFFTRAFVRAYAKEVGVDADALLGNDTSAKSKRLLLKRRPQPSRSGNHPRRDRCFSCSRSWRRARCFIPALHRSLIPALYRLRRRPSPRQLPSRAQWIAPSPLRLRRRHARRPPQSTLLFDLFAGRLPLCRRKRSHRRFNRFR